MTRTASTPLRTSGADPDTFRHVLSHVPTSVVVVTGARRGDAHAGMAVGSFTSISLDPQLVGFYPSRSSTSWPPIRDAGRFAVNVLAQGRHDLAQRFARRGGDKFAGIDVRAAPASGAAILAEGIVAWIDCELEREIELGDHSLVVGRVLDLGVVSSEVHPMVFSRGGYPMFADG